MENRVELCCHTKMSKLQGINEVEEYIEEAIKRGNKAIAITDTDSTQAFFKTNEYLKNNNKNKDFKVIYGTQMHFKDEHNIYTIYIYVKEQRGLNNLYKLISKAYKNIINEIPIVTKKDLIEHRDGLLYAAIGDGSEIYQKHLYSIINSIIDFYDFIGIVPNKADKKINIKINELCKKYNKTLIGTTECSFINKEDYICNEVLNFYKKLKNIKYGNTRYFQTTKELIKSFDYLENAKEIVVDNTIKIANSINQVWLKVPRSLMPKIENSVEVIAKECIKKTKELYGEKLPQDVENRLKVELESITKNNFENIYLISSELVKYSKELGYEVGNRGSVGNSFVAYLLGITEINPLEYNLPFEFFAGNDYDKEPDIDLNFSEKVRPKLFKYLQNKYGKDKVIWGGTICSLADKTVEECYEEFRKTYELDNNLDKLKIVRKLTGIKTGTAEHPGGVFILPDNVEINDICPIEIGEKNHIKTHWDYHSIWTNGLYKFDILSHDDLSLIHDLEKETNTNSNDIKLDDTKTLNFFLHANDRSYPISTEGIPEFATTYVKKITEALKPQNFNDLICIVALSHGTGMWTYNAESLIKNEHKNANEIISNRADMFNYLVKNGIEKHTAFEIVEFVRKGRTSKKRILWRNNINRYKELTEQWEKYKVLLRKFDIPEWYISNAEKIEYMFPKAHAIGYTINAFKIAWYKIYFPKAFYKVYFKIKSNLNVKDYYCKRQVLTELNRLYDLKEIHESNMELEYDYSNNYKIKDLELVLEMFNRGLIKEKLEIKDDYNLINSRAIADYCRSIKHKFNTEELAVLVYRNQNMSIEEKINKYKDLIKNYPDMEVLERINCKHYDSVKTLIKNEIQRLKILNKKLKQDDKNCIYSWTEYNKCTQKYEHNVDIEHTFRTYKEAFKDIRKYINEFDDTVSFIITKKYFDKRKEKIFAKFNVKNKKAVLVNISESNKYFFDLDQIFLNIPTPFKKGDILISNNLYRDSNGIFVLDYLCTWRKNLDYYLEDGNYDSSDMNGLGYFFINDNTTEFIRDHKWDYDSFEYYDGELVGRNRILKDISSFIKGKIKLELFVHAYDVYKAEFKSVMPHFYNAEGLKLAGMLDRKE